MSAVVILRRIPLGDNVRLVAGRTLRDSGAYSNDLTLEFRDKATGEWRPSSRSISVGNAHVFELHDVVGQFVALASKERR